MEKRRKAWYTLKNGAADLLIGSSLRNFRKDLSLQEQ